MLEAATRVAAHLRETLGAMNSLARACGCYGPGGVCRLRSVLKSVKVRWTCPVSRKGVGALTAGLYPSGISLHHLGILGGFVDDLTCRQSQLSPVLQA